MASSSKEYAAKYRAENREKIRERARKWAAEHGAEMRARGRERDKTPEALAKKRVYAAGWRDRNREYLRERDRTRYANNREKRAAYSLAWRWNKREQIAGKPRSAECDSCGEEAQTVFDHCHASGEFRGWLCCKCNAALGMLDDDPEKIRKLAVYMEKHATPAVAKAA